MTKNTQWLARLNEPRTVKRKRATREVRYALVSFTNPIHPVVKYPETMAFPCDEEGNVLWHTEMIEWHESEPDFERYADELGATLVRKLWEAA